MHDDSAPIPRLPLATLIICGACVIMDGFDVQAMGYVAPAIIRDWHIDKAMLGPVFGAGLAGMLFGSLILSIIADRVGRRPVLIGATLFFAIAMLATGAATSVQSLLLLRFLTGLGLGGIMPNAVALAGEQSPARIRVTVMMYVSVGFTVGAVLGGLVAQLIIPHWGWPSLFVVGGVIPLITAVSMLRFLPESTAFLADRSARPYSATQLFHAGRARTTTLLWVVNFMNLLNLYFLSSWIPTLTRDAGLSASAAVLAGTTLQFGGTIGTLVMARMIDRSTFQRILVPAFVIAAIAIVLIGRPTIGPLLLLAAIFVAGFCIVGAQPALNAFTAQYYPTPLRSTGLGWSLGIGRIGSIVGPVLGGILLRFAWPTSSILLVIAIPALISAAMLGLIREQ